MGGDHEGDTVVAVQRREELHDLDRRSLVEVSGRLVGQNDFRVAGEGPGNRDPLALSPGQSRRDAAHVVGESNPGEQFLGPDHASAALHPLEEQRPCHVLHRGQHRDEMEGLEHEAELLVSESGERAIVMATEVHALDSHGAGVRVVETADQVEQRALAAAGRAGRDHELAGFDFEIDRVQHPQPGTGGRIRLRHRLQ